MVSRKNQGVRLPPSMPPPPPAMKHAVPILSHRTPAQIKYANNMQKRQNAEYRDFLTQGSEGLKKIQQLYHGGRKRTHRRRTNRRRTHRR
jgi:hypothetical protein